MTQQTEKQLPSSIEAENLLIGSVIQDNELLGVIYPALDPGDFYSARNKAIARAMLAIPAQQPISHLTIVEQLNKEGNGLGITVTDMAQYLVGLMYKEQDIKSAIEQVKKTSIARKLIHAHNEAIAEIWDGNEDLKQIVEKHDQKFSGLTNALYSTSKFQRKGFQSLYELRDKFKEHLADYNQNKTSATRTGFDRLDQKLDGGGLQPSGLYFLGAPPKCGKTALALKVARNVAFKQKRIVLASSAEMNVMSLYKRLYSADTGIPFSSFRPGFSGPDYEQAIEHRVDKFASKRLKISDSLHTIEDLKRYVRTECERAYKEDEEVGLAIVDYLQIYKLNESVDWKNRAAEVGKISREVKVLAMECMIPILAISALNRNPLKEKRKAEMSDLRESGSLEYDAEAIWFLHNERAMTDDDFEPEPVEDIEFILAAQRNGPVTSFMLKFLGPYMDYMDEREYNEYSKFAGGKAEQTEFEETMQGIEEDLFSNVTPEEPDEWDLGSMED